jgi:hypothetical protein
MQPGLEPSNKPGFEPSTQSNNEPCIESDIVISKTVSPASYFTNKETSLTCEKPPTKKRKYLTTIVSGKAITENDMFEVVKEHEAARKPSSTGKGKKTSEKGKNKRKVINVTLSLVPLSSC